MSKGVVPAPLVGNDFFVPQTRLPNLQVAAAAPAAPVSKPVINIPVLPVTNEYSFEVAVNTPRRPARPLQFFQSGLDFMHEYSVGTFAVLFLLVGGTATQVVGSYQSAKIAASVPASHIVHKAPLAGLNVSVPTNELDSKLHTITGQALTITMGDKTETIPADTMQNWLQVVTDKTKNTSYIHVKDTTILASLQALAKKNSKDPVNQVSATHGGVTSIIATGKNGVKVADPSLIAKEIGKHVLAGAGMKFDLPAETVPFQAVTPAAFTKMIEVNVVTKQMYLYDNGNLTKQYAISAGAPETPTPIGQFKTYSKLTVQDMRGYNPNGTKYFQPHVRWISYFLPGGYAIHGNYWRPTSWFGARNSSHGCVSLPDWQAKEVFDWAPVGTTVITHV